MRQWPAASQCLTLKRWKAGRSDDAPAISARSATSSQMVREHSRFRSTANPANAADHSLRALLRGQYWRRRTPLARASNCWFRVRAERCHAPSPAARIPLCRDTTPRLAGCIAQSRAWHGRLLRRTRWPSSGRVQSGAMAARLSATGRSRCLRRSSADTRIIDPRVRGVHRRRSQQRSVFDLAHLDSHHRASGSAR